MSDLILLVEQQDKKRAKRMYEVQEAAKLKPEWVFEMPFRHPARR